MGKQDNVAEHCVAIAMATLGLSGAAAAVPVSLAVLASVGFNHLRNQRKACTAAITDVITHMPNADDATLAEVRTVLDQAETGVTFRNIPAPVSQDKTLTTALVGEMMQGIPQSASYDARSIIEVAFQHAVEACRYTPDLHARISQDLLWRLVGQTAEVRATVLHMADLFQNRILELEDVARDLSNFTGMINGALIAYGADAQDDPKATVTAIIELVHDALGPVLIKRIPVRLAV